MSAAASTPCPPEHKHGRSGTCYNQHGCRCSPCRDSLSARVRARRRAKLYGRYVDPFVSTEPVRAHLRQLEKFGIGWTRAAELAGVSPAAVQRVVTGHRVPIGDPHHGEESRRILRTSAAALLAVRADLASLSPAARISSEGLRRRVQALMALGWSNYKIADAMGENPQNWARTVRMELVTVRRHLALAEVFDRLSIARPPLDTPFDRAAASRSMNTARRNGWAAPAAWDDIDADEGPAVPDEPVEVDDVAVELAMDGRRIDLRPAERREAIRRLNARGYPDQAIADRLHLTSDAVHKVRVRASIPAAVGADRERIVA